MHERRDSFTLTVVLVLVTSMLSYVAGAVGLVPWVNEGVGRLASPGQARPPLTAGANGVDVNRLNEVIRAIQQQYVDPVEVDKLNTGALKGLVESLGDRHSSYWTAEEYKRFNQHIMEGESFTGIGVHVEMSQRTGLVTVLSPIKGSPGQLAGLKAGDAILKVDDRDITNMTLNEAVLLIRGPKGTPVRLTVKREGITNPMEFTIVRDTIKVPSIEYSMLEPGVGYVRLYEFTRGTGKLMQDALTDLKGQGMTRLIFDLRQNPGGLLDEAVTIASLFVPNKQPVVHIVEKGDKKRTHSSLGKQPLDMPLVVLVDGGSASASEIVAGAVKDLKIGTLMGLKTFGKGSVQTFWEFPDGSGIKLTTAKYLTAGEKSINGVGIDPDMVVENPDKIFPGGQGDPQLAAALRHIKSK